MRILPFRWRFAGSALLVGGAAVIAGSPAYAHAHLRSAQPAPGAGAADVREIRLQFSEAVEPALSGLRLETGDGRAIAEPPAEADPADADVLVAHLSGRLAAGRYAVQWVAVGRDGHRTHGAYGFTVSP